MIDKRVMSQSPACRRQYDRVVCDNTIVGGMCREMMQRQKGGQLLPKQAREIHESVIVFSSWLLPAIQGVQTLSDHKGCNPFSTTNSFHADLEQFEQARKKPFGYPYRELEVDIEFPTRSHRNYMAAQRGKTGYQL